MASDPSPTPLTCPRCETGLEYFGTKKLREGFTKSSPMSPKRTHPQVGEHFDVYACVGCGHVEFFVDGVGEELRPH